MMLMVTAVWAMIAGRAAERAQLRRDLPWSIFYAGNWGQIAGGVPYWATDPPLLRHLWSLGVEEQWYLLWPLLFVVLSTLPLCRRAVAVVLAAASLAAMVAMFWLHGNGPGPIHSGIDAFDGADRINFMYLATFTRCAGLLLGAAAAHVWRPWRWSRVARHPVTNVPLLDAAGGGAVAGLFVIACSVSILDGYVYQWLLALVSILSLVAVLTAVHPGASWHRAALSLPPLVAIGRRSYGLYLWSWPIFVILGATHGSVARVMVALAVTAVVSEACYRFVELPVRHGALGRWWRRSPPRQRLIPLAWATAAVVAIVAFYATVGPYNRALGGADASFSLPTSTVATATTVAGAATPGVVVGPSTSAVAAGPLPVVVVGDSTGYALVLNAPDGIDDTFAITDGSIEGCSVYAAGSTRSSNAALDHSFVGCDRWEHEWADAASKGAAKVALVVLGAWDVFDLEDGDGTDLTFGTPAVGRLRGRSGALRHRRTGRGRGEPGRPAGSALHASGARRGRAGLRRARRRRPCRPPQRPLARDRRCRSGNGDLRRRPDRVVPRPGGGHRPRLSLGRRARVEAGLQPHLRDDRARPAGARGSLSRRATLSGRSTPAAASR